MPLLEDLKSLIRPTDAEGNPLPASMVSVKLSKEAKRDLAIGGGIFVIINAALIAVALKISK